MTNMENNMVTTNMPVSRGRRTHGGSGTQDGAQSHMGSGLGAGLIQASLVRREGPLGSRIRV